MAATAWAKLLDRNTLSQMAGGRSFERGQECFSEGCVRGLAEHAETITAKIQGTHDYSCTCPVGADGDFCKHCVAMGLAWLNPEKNRGSSGEPSVSMDDARVALASQPKESLVALLLEHALEVGRSRVGASPGPHAGLAPGSVERLMPPRPPKGFPDHAFAQRFFADDQAMPLGKLFASKDRAKIFVMLFDESQRSVD